jgi:hypothetical protein
MLQNRWADHLLATGTFEHGGADGMGQNLAMMSGDQVKLWILRIEFHYPIKRTYQFFDYNVAQPKVLNVFERTPAYRPHGYNYVV